MTLQVIEKTISTSFTKLQGASLTVLNPFDMDVFVNLIEIIPTDDFALKGKMRVEVNGVNETPNNDSPFYGYSKYPLQLGVLLPRGKFIIFYAWNGTDAGTISTDVKIYLDAEQKEYGASAESLTEKPLVGTALSSATNTIYTCPLGKKARIFGQVLLDGYGAASLVALQIDSSPIEEWQIPDFGTSTSYDAVSGDSYFGKAIGQSFSQYRKRPIDIKVAAGQVLKKTQNIGDNATLYYSLKVMEERA